MPMPTENGENPQSYRQWTVEDSQNWLCKVADSTSTVSSPKYDSFEQTPSPLFNPQCSEHLLGIVLDFTEPFQHCNLHIYFDNFFTSVNGRELLRCETYACGTLHTNRYPDSFKVKKGGRKQGIKLKAGERRRDTMLIIL